MTVEKKTKEKSVHYSALFTEKAANGSYSGAMWFGDKDITPERVLKSLRDEFDRRMKRNSGYSIRAYARDLDMDYSHLAKVMKGERTLTWNFAAHVLDRIPLVDED